MSFSSAKAILNGEIDLGTFRNFSRLICTRRDSKADSLF